MSYIVQGFIFVKVFEFIVYDKKDRNFNSLTLESVALSFIIKLLYNKTIIALISLRYEVNYNSEFYYIGLIIISILLAYISGRFVLSKPFLKICERLKIVHTINSNFWLDVYKENAWYAFYMKNGNWDYMGQIDYIEEGASTPYILLINYSVYDKNGEEVEISENKNEKRSIIIHMSDVEHINVIENK